MSVRAAWTRLGLGTLCQTLLIMLLSLYVWAAAPAALGWKPTTVSSGSMLPRLWVGDIAVSRPLNGPPSLGQVLLYEDPDHPGRLRMHRLVRVDDEGRLVTKGDANPNEDSTPITPDAIRGVGMLRIPFVGLPIVWLREGRFVPLTLALVGLGLLLAGAQLTRPLLRQAEQEGDGADQAWPEDEAPAAPPEDARGTPAAAATTPDRELVAAHSGDRSKARGDGAGETEQDAAADQDAEARPEPVLEPVAYLARERRTRRVRIVALGFTLTSVLVVCSSVFSVTAAAGFSEVTGASENTWSSAPYYSCLSAARPDAPAMYYPLDEAGGTLAADSSGSSRSGTYVGTITRGVAGACSEGTAITLSGSSGLIATPTRYTSPNTFTLEIWFNTTTTARGGRLIGFGSSRTSTSSDADRHIYMTDTGRLVFGTEKRVSVQCAGLTSEYSTISSPSACNDGQWHLATAVLSSAGARLYVDGTLVASDSSITSGLSTSGYWRIGYDKLSGWPSQPTSAYFAGSVDNVGIYTTALSATTIRTHYQARS
jgi:signal peptidase I